MMVIIASLGKNHCALTRKPYCMRIFPNCPIKYIISSVLLLGSSFAFSQVPATSDVNDMNRLENRIKAKQTLGGARFELDSIYHKTSTTGDYILQARSLNYLIVVRDQLTEDSLYFRNSAAIDTLLRSAGTSAKLKAVMYVMQARRVGQFDQLPHKFNIGAYRLKNLMNNYAALSAEQRTELSGKFLDSALLVGKFSVDEAKQLKWLSGNPDVFLFDPQFEDIVLSEKVNLAGKQMRFVDARVDFSAMLAISGIAFNHRLDSLATLDLKDGRIAVLNAYRDWMNFNKNNEAVKVFIESLARKNIYLSMAGDSVAQAAYTQYLLSNMDSRFDAVKAHSVYQLCLLWNQDGNKYKDFKDKYRYWFPGAPQPFDPRYQYLPAKALQLYRQHSILIDKYPAFKQVLEIMAKQITAKALRVEINDEHLPDETIPLTATYKNTDTLFYRVVRVNANEAAGKGIIPVANELIMRPAALSGVFALPLPADNNVHAIYLNLNALPAGSYKLLFSHKPLNAVNDALNTINFNVTGIIAVNTDERIFVLNRKTGYPIAGAHIAAFKKKALGVKGVATVVPANGYVTVQDGIADSLSISYRGDTLGYDINAIRKSNNNNAFDKDEYDDLTDFYDDKVTMEIFTDRGIYRPGQTVHYKIIFLTKHPKTGEAILFNKQNLGGGIFKTRLSKWLADDNDLIVLRDALGKTIDSARLKINGFGSFAGSFVLPKAAATGSWNIDGEAQADYQNDGSFRVEEYKRPTIELSMEKQKKVFLPGEPFTVKLKLRSFNGSDLSNVPIKYTLQRSGSLPRRGSMAMRYDQVKLVDTTGYTNAQGELLIAVKDTAISNTVLSDSLMWRYDYSIVARAVDLTGESTDLNGSVEVYSRPVNIIVNVSAVVDRQALTGLTIRTTDEFAGDVPRKVSVRIYKTNDPHQNIITKKQVDQWYDPRIVTGFPEDEAGKKNNHRQLLLDTIVNTTDNEKLTLDSKLFPAGFYELEAMTREGDHTFGKTQRSFTVFDSKAGEWVGNELNYMPFNFAKPGEKLSWFGSGRTDNFSIYRSTYINKNNKTVTRYETFLEKAGIRKWSYTVPPDATGQVLLSRITVKNNNIALSEQRVYLNRADKISPQIIVERYRRVMGPGAQEKFTVSVKTRSDNIAAELMTTLYDASLDKLEEHNWRVPLTSNNGPYVYDNWTNISTTQRMAEYLSADMEPVNLFKLSAMDRENGVFYALEGRVAGLNVTSASGLEEVVVVGYGVSKQNLSYAVTNLTIRGNSSIEDILKKIPGLEVDASGNVITLGRSVTKARLNGKDYIGGDLKSLAMNLPADIIDKFQVVDDYGDQASLVGFKGLDTRKILNFAVSADGSKINILLEPPPPVVKIRKSFNETAFFFPQIHADADGFYIFSFTMPETATEWNWKLLAHTRDARFAYLEKKLQTQLSLMVQPNMPRLLYQGDKIKLQSRISNLDTLAILGNATCKIEDAVTGQDITALLVANAGTTFNLDKKSTGSVAFMLNVPATQTNPLKIIITATGGGAADAEEHVIPVLSSKVFIRQSVAVKFEDKPSITINKPQLPADAISYGVGISINQQPQASLIYALPWLANYSFDCAEQTFNKLRAYATALIMIQRDTDVQNAFKSAKAFMEGEQPKTDALPNEMAEVTMPWLSLGNNTAERQKEMYRLLDTTQSKANIDKHLRRLYSLQRTDGALSWFEGGKNNDHISAYVLAGFGQLKQMKWVADRSIIYQQQAFIDRLVKYGQNRLVTDSVSNADRADLIYALSYWLREQPASPELLTAVTKALETAWSKAGETGLQQQALLIINTMRYLPAGNALRAKADVQLENIRQRAIQDDAHGIRWKAIADAERMNESAEETMALLAEAFEGNDKYKDVQTGIVKWLLTAKQQQHWQTTTATAAAVNMLQKEKSGAFGGVKAFSADVAGKQINVADGLLDGKPADFFATKEAPASIALKQSGTDAAGVVTWYYFARPEGLDTLGKKVKISKQFFIYDANTHGVKQLLPGVVLKPGDKLQVKLTVDAAVSLQYVQISDPRAALFEPGDNVSGYQYVKGGGYYQSVRDTGLELFTEVIPRGITEFTYDLVVAHSGEFSCGPATLQCMYQPAVTAYSGTQNFRAE